MIDIETALKDRVLRKFSGKLIPCTCGGPAYYHNVTMDDMLMCIECGYMTRTYWDGLEYAIEEWNKRNEPANQQKTICLKCNIDLEDVQGGQPHIQPMGGLAFMTYGHYGSTIFDPMDGSWLEIAVCDNCLLDYFKQVAPHLIEVWPVNYGHGDIRECEGLKGNPYIERKVATLDERDMLLEDYDIIEDPFVSSDPQPYHPEINENET